MSTSPHEGATPPTVAFPVPDADRDNRDGGDRGRGLQNPTPPPAAKTPLGPGVVTVVGLALAVLVVALGVVGVHDALVAAGAVNGTPWIDAAVQPLSGLTPAAWLVPVGIALTLLGLWLLLTALRPRPRRAIALQASTGVFLRNRDVATLARNAAQDVDGVTSAKVTANPRKVVVAATTTTTEDVEPSVTEAVATRLGALAKMPAIRVHVKAEGGL